jgi:hypothetical protein
MQDDVADNDPFEIPVPIARDPFKGMVECPNCGDLCYPSQLMHASRGVACPECYDEMSD